MSLLLSSLKHFNETLRKRYNFVSTSTFANGSWEASAASASGDADHDLQSAPARAELSAHCGLHLDLPT